MDNKLFIEAYRGLNSSYLRLVDSLSALRALSSLSIEHCSDSELLERALSVLVENQDLERCSIYLREGDSLRRVAGLGWSELVAFEHNGEVIPHRDEDFLVGLSDGLVGRAAATGELQRCDVCDWEKMQHPFCQGCSEADPARGNIVGSLISMPIRGNGEVLGVLSISHPHQHFFDEGHERSLRIFADVLGQLLINNRLVHQMEDLVLQRTAQLQKALEDAEELRRRYETLSVIDDLTQLHNRRFFFPEARAALSRALRHELPYSLLLIDLDHFKAINDNFGHATGDMALQQVAATLKSVVREGDVLARFGGEEFVVALPETEAEGAMALAQRIRAAVKACCWELEGRTLAVTLSIGIATVESYLEQDSQQQLDLLVIQADQALYFGKHHGRDQACHYGDIACRL